MGERKRSDVEEHRERERDADQIIRKSDECIKRAQSSLLPFQNDGRAAAPHTHTKRIGSRSLRSPLQLSMGFANSLLPSSVTERIADRGGGRKIIIKEKKRKEKKRKRRKTATLGLASHLLFRIRPSDDAI